jgi:hypothetical protein
MARDDGAGHHRPEGFTPETLGLAEDMKSGPVLLRHAPAGCATLDVRLGRNSLWLVIRSGGTALALRTAHAATQLTAKKAAAKDAAKGAAKGAVCAFTAECPEGVFRVVAELKTDKLLRVRTWLTPSKPMLVPFWPRDLYPLGPGDDPTQARGEVIAAQRGSTPRCCSCA